MADRAAIVDTLNKYAWGYDAAKVDLLEDSFTADAVMSLQIIGQDVLGPFEGRDAIVKMMTDSMEAQDDQRRHVISNWYFASESDDSAEVVSYLTLITIADGQLTVVCTGVYEDVVVNDSGHWRIKKRMLTLDLPF
jgi:3-phenylpropionate/cinnamic acid dioxygenase small subunit